MSKERPTRDWRVSIDRSESWPYIEIVGNFPDGTGVTICTMGITDKDGWGGYVGEEEDAKIVALAPEMLEVIQDVVKQRYWFYDGAFKVCRHCGSQVPPSTSPDEMKHDDKCLYRRAVQLLAKT